MKVFFKNIIIYTNYNFALDIAIQITLSTNFTNKLNLKLIRVFDYIQHFNLKIRYKFDKQHIVLNVLFKFFSDNVKLKIINNKNELNALFTVFLIEINEVF